MLIDEADCYRFAVSAAGLKRDEPAKAGSFRVKFWKVLAEAKVLRKVLPKVLKGTYRYDVLQNVTDRLIRQELSTRVREIIREAAGLPDHQVSALGIGGPQGSRCGTAKGTCRRQLSSGPQPSRPGTSFMPAKRDSPNRALQASPITSRSDRRPIQPERVLVTH